ncbi:dolichol-phosphate mannosyltransferase subunit 3 isoform X2 [Procambarus clarkii]|uniref:dolichol-phosphate mannosyltransferase subunit 3 isoform X2 n=1 Tax=Procambarus clarkii TaxID=6728 RepID=UPI001E678106|nr:dolichol-phosphate mannosyltransferase subunit 3-like isoform X2 [Procambarus clarkii]
MAAPTRKSVVVNVSLLLELSQIIMTKLMEWLTGAVLILGPWSAVVTNTIQNEFTKQYYWEILLLPVLLVALFGLVSVAIIAYRVYTFNDCQEAAQELQNQIKEAKSDLIRKGLKFDKT